MPRLRTSRSRRIVGSGSGRGKTRSTSTKKPGISKRAVGVARGRKRLQKSSVSSSKKFLTRRGPRSQKDRGTAKSRKRVQKASGDASRVQSPETKPSPIKTRRLQKSKQLNVSRCTICKASDGELSSCSQCHKLYHLSKCILFSPAMIARVEYVQWLCPKCIRCEACHEMVDDPANVECVSCLKAWHGACKPTGSTTADRQWSCDKCLKSRSATPRKSSPQKLRRRSSNANVAQTPTPNRPLAEGGDANAVTPRRKRGRRTKNSETGFAAVDDASLPGPSGLSHHYWTANVRDSDLSALPRSVQTGSISPSIGSPKRTFVPEIPDSLSSTLGAQLFHEALKSMEECQKARPIKTEELIGPQWVNLGGETDIKVLYESPYPDDIKNAPLFFICVYCLKSFSEQNSFLVHRDCCPRICPPGQEIYRDQSGSLSFFEVDGSVERTYCRNLCLLAMLFISSKTLHSEVATFLFYILTKNDANGCRIVGYFSKEKNPSRNNNLSCLLTIPSDQRNGYGHLLIDMSYKLSALERKVGSPEHPLSDLGLLTYRKYWKSSILCYLRSRKDAHNISIKNMSLETRIHPTDIVNELLFHNLLIMKDGNYFIKTWKLAFKFPLSMLRRRTVDPTRIQWSPSFDVSSLDAQKLNHYA
ncbi:hypothetical protein Q1695_013296 [Nippostrongylus brasiliensis]|nr:hypothetical protein Q1695_013296 [Nippostrongylus brasiliensis]